MKTRLRDGLSVACGVVGVVVLVCGVVYMFTVRSLLNADMFAARVADGPERVSTSAGCCRT
jgi:hypothetical protein